MTVNHAKSIRDRLLNISKNEKISFHIIVARYIQERFLYRLSKSQYRDRFYLKGGALIYAIYQLSARPTLDIDFLGVNVVNDLSEIQRIFKEIGSLEDETDGIIFLTDNIHVEELMENRKYKGLRITIDARLDTMKERISIDIGFGDVFSPAPHAIDYPSLFDRGNKISLNAYSVESIIAEKFEAMISLSLSNSRMKDFYDVFNLLQDRHYNVKKLESAITSTFRNRGTKYIADHPLFSPEFVNDKKRLQMWERYLKKIKSQRELDFKTVISEIREVLFPIWATI